MAVMNANLSDRLDVRQQREQNDVVYFIPTAAVWSFLTFFFPLAGLYALTGNNDWFAFILGISVPTLSTFRCILRNEMLSMKVMVGLLVGFIIYLTFFDILFPLFLH